MQECRKQAEHKQVSMHPCISLLLTMDGMCPAVLHFCFDLPTIIYCNLDLKAKFNTLSPKLLFVRNEARTASEARTACIFY